MLRYDKYRLLLFILDTNHTNDLVVPIIVQRHTFNTRGGTSHHTHGTLVETDGTPVPIGDNHLVVAIRHPYLYQSIILMQRNSVYAILTRPGISLQQCLLYHALLRTEQQIMRIDELRIGCQFLHADKGLYLIVRLDVQ